MVVRKSKDSIRKWPCKEEEMMLLAYEERVSRMSVIGEGESEEGNHIQRMLRHLRGLGRRRGAMLNVEEQDVL